MVNRIKPDQLPSTLDIYHGFIALKRCLVSQYLWEKGGSEFQRGDSDDVFAIVHKKGNASLVISQHTLFQSLRRVSRIESSPEIGIANHNEGICRSRQASERGALV